MSDPLKPHQEKRFKAGFLYDRYDRTLRPVISTIASYLQDALGGTGVLFEPFIEDELAVRDREKRLSTLLQTETKLLILVLSRDYPQAWRKSPWMWIENLVFTPENSVMFFRAGDPGSSSEHGIKSAWDYVDIYSSSATSICSIILKRLESISKEDEKNNSHLATPSVKQPVSPEKPPAAEGAVEESLLGKTKTVIPDLTPPSQEVFISYAWNAESCAIIDKLQEALIDQGIRLVRDREEVRYKDSIRDFMRGISKGKAVVVVISEKYLKSENCMFEMVEIAKAQNLRQRIFPIVLTDANIYRATGRIHYVKHWEDQIHELDQALKTVRGDNLTNLQEDLNVYAEIRRLFDGIAETLRDMNALTADQHESSHFDDLIRRIREQLAS